MPAPAHTLTADRRPAWWMILLVLAIVAASFAPGLAAAPAHAASQGVGFGTWAPVSPYGWHGSMLIDGVHTYCILPGAPAPTGASTDHGVSTTAAGLSPEQLAAVNFLVTTYGQTNDPVQAAAVGWSVKAIADWDETLHHFGYRGDSLAGAIHWTFSALAPAQSVEVQRRAVRYYDEARSMAAGATRASGKVVLTTDAADHRSGTVRVEASTRAATGTLTLVDATFADTGDSTRTDVVPGEDYRIATSPPSPGRPYAVRASGIFTLTSPAAAVRHFTTSGGQDTAGPAGPVTFAVEGADASPRVPQFAPTITTQVAAKYVTGGPFIDDVSFAGTIDDWPRSADGSSLPVVATAEVYRTDQPPQQTDEGVPAGAEHVGSLGVTTDAKSGPTGPYRVTSLWDLPGPGFYTAVWSVRAGDQSAEVAPFLPAGYAWIETFGEPSQITMMADVSSLAEPLIDVGSTMSDKIIVAGPLPVGGLTVTSSVYRAFDGAEPEESCTDETHVWTSEPHTMSDAGEHVVISPAVDLPGTYFWRERAVDAAGDLVHLGACGVPHETTRVRTVETAPRPEPEAAAPSALAATGSQESVSRMGAAVGIALLTTGGTLVGLTGRRRSGARSQTA
jgi:hypothetical protein